MDKMWTQEIRTVYTMGTGGKHSNREDANRWRALTTHIAKNIRSIHPDMPAGIITEHAELHAEHITHLRNNAIRYNI